MRGEYIHSGSVYVIEKKKKKGLTTSSEPKYINEVFK